MAVCCTIRLIVSAVVCTLGAQVKYCLNYVYCGMFIGKITTDFRVRSS